MALIYSRFHFKLPQIMVANSPKRKKQKLSPRRKKQIYFCFIFCFIIGIMVKSVIPIFNSMCLEKAKSIATIITNEETQNVMQGYEYPDFMVIHKDTQGNILMLESNMKNINSAISNIAQQIQMKIDSIEQENIEINLGSFTGIHFLVGRGIKIPIRVITAGNVVTTVKSELINQGINQTLHRLYLEIECEISILTPFHTLRESIINQVILTENIIIGNIPSNYYNIEGINENQALELIQ